MTSLGAHGTRCYTMTPLGAPLTIPQGGGCQKYLYPPCPPSRGNTVPYLPKICEKPCTWWQELSLELSFEAQSSLQMF